MPTIKAFCAYTAFWDADEELIEAGQSLYSRNLSIDRQGKHFQSQQLEAIGKAAFYIYELRAQGESYTGVWALTSFADINNGRIKGCEQKCVDDCGGRTVHRGEDNPDASPVLIAYPADPQIEELIARAKLTTTPKMISLGEQENWLWTVSEPTLMEELVKAFGELGTVFLADGHNRIPGMASVPGPQPNHDELHLVGQSVYLSTLYMAENQLRSLPCHKLLKPGHPINPESILQVIEKNFEIMASPGNMPIEPDRAHRFGLYLDGRWYQLILRQHALNGASFTGRLDGNILYSHILLPTHLLPGSAQGVSHIGGAQALQELTGLLVKDCSLIAFTLYPASLNLIMSVGYTDGTLEPGTNWIEPKIPENVLICNINATMPL
ncbi:DUF1015 family protein [Mucilaginibacter jinjuensis]|uniref:DUF1015 family protein n=1 Tax=Mucilaginibacter jinjuensis TaxID=1176721 RepID=A0ABY7TC39_9SPHI|nr:DUF1015 family protein [Mucilaginibacter jinjuensis]WCT14084.1 DUF1015 family protein [Mucilaginibacter jinjuensis]